MSRLNSLRKSTLLVISERSEESLRVGNKGVRGILRAKSALRITVFRFSQLAAISFPDRLLQRSHVDDEAVFHIALEQAIVGLIDLVNSDQFNVGSNSALGAEIQHLLGFSDTADD